MTRLVPLPVVIPLVAAAICILVGRWRVVQRFVAVTALTATTGVSIALLVGADRNGPLVMHSGGWEAPLGITLVVDRLAGLMLTVGSIMLLAVLIYAIGQPGAERDHVGFQSVYMILAAGVGASFVVGDLFTLFVAFEMMLTASYVLLTIGGGRQQVRSGMTYVVISLIASTLFVVALALIYASTGTVNMADLSSKMADLPPGVAEFIAVLLIVVFGIKAGLFPLFFWLPDAYPVAPGPVTAVFAGLLTKVGVYAMIRSQMVIVPDFARPQSLMLVLAGLTMIVGILGAIAQDDIKRILSFNIVSHIGFMVMGLALFSEPGLAATVLYIVHHIVAKTTLFLTSGLVEHAGGSSQLSRLGEMVRTTPVIAALFLVPALALAGVPPLSGFVPKLGLTRAGFEVGQYAIVIVSLVASLLTVLSLIKIWAGAFWSPAGDTPDRTPLKVGRLGGPLLMVAPTIALAGLSLAIAFAAGPLYDLCRRAAAELLDRSQYVVAVLG